MLIHFEIRGERRWEALGSGESADAVDPLQGAIDDLRSLHGGDLPAGSYRYIVAQGEDPRWEKFDLGPAGVVSIVGAVAWSRSDLRKLRRGERE